MYRRCYVPKTMNEEKLKEIFDKSIISSMKIHFKCNPRATVYEVNKRIKIRKVFGGYVIQQR